MGDSYASGVGAGPQPGDDTNRCFRFPNAYPVVAQAALNPVPAKFNNVACSGNTFNQIKEKELLDEPEDDGNYGTRPVWGADPEFVTITMGGNDIGILNLISTCILSFKLWGMDCEEVIQYGHDTIDSQKFKDDLNGLIQAIVDKGRKTKVGDQFKVFVTGYAKFFNQERTQCNDVDFKPPWNPLPAQKLTVERRTAMNDLALALNKALSAAVDGFKDKGVFYVDYDNDFNDHRFCDRDEPAPDDPDTWFFNWYTKEDPKSEAAKRVFEKMQAYQASIQGGKENTFKTDSDYINAVADAAKDDPEGQSILSDSVRIFHPTTRGHEKIRDIVIKALNDNGIPGEKKDPPKKAPYAEGTCCFHAVQWYDPFKKDGDSGEPYSVELRLLDNAKNEIKFVPKTDCGDKHPLVITSKLEAVLRVTPEEHDDYIQYDYKDQHWKTNDKDNAKCNVGGWDGWEYPDVSTILIFYLPFSLFFIALSPTCALPN
ncbi:MAG: hypothetical protein LQ342_007790 [Letrouitia transgressa]|nr:MAG: hypothetical protein LQ342_007790 [Letrouitia transgressa]